MKPSYIQLPERIASAMNRVELIIKELNGPPPWTPCKDCDWEVGFICPVCDLRENAMEIVRWLRYESNPNKEPK